jgi:hypothetical protein
MFAKRNRPRRNEVIFYFVLSGVGPRGIGGACNIVVLLFRQTPWQVILQISYLTREI